MEAFPVLSFVALFFALAAAGEPRCSRFDYDERTLEKMIRTEIKCEAVLSDVKDLKELVREELERVKAEKKKTELEIQTALADGAVEKKKMIDEIQTALAEVEVEKEKMKAIKALQPTVVSFKAKMTATASLSNGDTLVFQDVVSNHGNGYDRSKGMFRAPVGGVYLFTLQICVQIQQFLVLETVIDDIAVNHAVMYEYYNHICHAHTDLVTLAANSSITFRSGSSSSSTVIFKVDSTQWTNFVAGVLLVKQ